MLAKNPGERPSAPPGFVWLDKDLVNVRHIARASPHHERGAGVIVDGYSLHVAKMTPSDLANLIRRALPR
jgi:hypothetical protein